MSRLIFNCCNTGNTPLRKFLLAAAGWTVLMASGALSSAASAQIDYRVLATSKTSTMEKELNEAAVNGYRFSKLMGGRTANGGQEVAIAMLKYPVSPGSATV